MEYLGDAYAAMGQHANAHQYWQQALERYRTQRRVGQMQRAYNCGWRLERCRHRTYALDGVIHTVIIGLVSLPEHSMALVCQETLK